MKDFDPYSILLQCCPSPLTEEHKKSTDFYSMVMPQAYCCWDRGFYFQPTLLEFDFNTFSPKHSSKKTFIMMRWNPKPIKKVTGLDGVEVEFPVLIFYICVNRGIFKSRAASHNEVEWLAAITQRTKGIAHELLYADHYAKYFDPTSGSLVRPVEIPNVEQEDGLLCPSHQIEHTLHSVEREFGMLFENEAAFISQQATSAVQKYYHLWLKNYGVERDVCHRRTCQYLRSQMRNVYQMMDQALNRCMEKHRLEKMDAQKIKFHIHEKTEFGVDFLAEMRKNGCPTCSDSELAHHAVIMLARRNGH